MKNIFELNKRYNTNYYNLNTIIAVGYCVNSKKSIIFRIWTSRLLKESIIKGYVMDNVRLQKLKNFFVQKLLKEPEKNTPQRHILKLDTYNESHKTI